MHVIYSKRIYAKQSFITCTMLQRKCMTGLTFCITSWLLTGDIHLCYQFAGRYICFLFIEIDFTNIKRKPFQYYETF